MRDNLGEALKTLYGKELAAVRVPPVPWAPADQGRSVRRGFPLTVMWWGAAACAMAAGLLFALQPGNAESGLARLITETGRKYEWQKRFETGDRTAAEAFVDGFTRR
ncbi:MAG: hypothetical protein JXD23_05990 [Spirochaetales bacterium]|nr:hypothetical protein [Spirochaetales bacterium]